MIRIPETLLAALCLTSLPLQARVTRIVIDETVSPAFCKGGVCPSFGAAGQYEQIAGRAFGELDPSDPKNSLIQDIDLGRDKDGKVRALEAVRTKLGEFDTKRSSWLQTPPEIRSLGGAIFGDRLRFKSIRVGCVENSVSGHAMRPLDVIRTQFSGSFAGLTADQMAKVVIAYEPVWAIGTGRTARGADAASMAERIRAAVTAGGHPEVALCADKHAF